MERLSRVAHRIVWVNPRTKSDQYQPLAGGMAAAWPYCDAVVSAHTVHALDELTAALAHPARHRPASETPPVADAVLSGDRGRGDAWRRPGKVLRLLVRPGVPLMRSGVPLVRPCVPLVRLPGVPLVRPCGVPYPPCVSLDSGRHCLRFRLPRLWRG